MRRRAAGGDGVVCARGEEALRPPRLLCSFPSQGRRPAVAAAVGVSGWFGSEARAVGESLGVVSKSEGEAITAGVGRAGGVRGAGGG